MSWEHDKFWPAACCVTLNTPCQLCHGNIQPPQAIPKSSLAMETGFFGLWIELSHFNHNKYQNTGGRSPTAQWYVLWKNFDICILAPLCPDTVLGSEGSKQLILICLWNKVCRKTGFHKAQTIPFETSQSEAHCQIQGRMREEPRGLATLEVVVSSATGQMFPKGRNTGNCGKLHNWISQKEKRFSYNRGTLQQVPVRPRSYCFLRHIFWKVQKGAVCSANILNADPIDSILDVWLWVEKSIIWNCISLSGDRVIPGN